MWLVPTMQQLANLNLDELLSKFTDTYLNGVFPL